MTMNALVASALVVAALVFVDYTLSLIYRAWKDGNL
jgi:hypothetical protein